MAQKCWFNWSSGKDSALALDVLLKDGCWSVEHLLTTVNAALGRVTMHGVRNELLQQQFEAMALPYTLLQLPAEVDHDGYNVLMDEAVANLQRQGFVASAFGDIFLEDLRAYRESQLARYGVQGVFPLWKMPAGELLQRFFSGGFKAVVVACDDELLGEGFLGRDFDEDFIKDLPRGVDVCGENGEFHTFCYDAPYFSRPVEFVRGGHTKQMYSHGGKQSAFWFCDLLPVGGVEPGSPIEPK